MEEIKLGDIITQISGVSYKPVDLRNSLDNTSVVLLRANNIYNGSLIFDDVQYVRKEKVKNEQYLREGDILICGSSGSKNLVGKAAYVTENMNVTFGAFCKVIRPSVKMKKYIGYFFQSQKYRNIISNTAIGANINNIKKEHIDNIQIPLYTEEKQAKIIKMLDNIFSIKEKRELELEQLDLLIKARFIEMFGDPILNPNKWVIVKLTELGTLKNGMNFHYSDSGVNLNCLGVGDFQNNDVIDSCNKLPFISLNEMPADEYLLKDNDIVFVRSNGNKALVGRSVLVLPKNTKTTFSGFCIRYRLSSKKLNTLYLLQVLKSPSIRKRMAGRGANIQNLNQQILSNLDIPIPPIELQTEYSYFVEQIDKSKVAVQKSLDEAQLLYDSLMQKYFD